MSNLQQRGGAPETVVRKQRLRPFTMIPNELILDPNISDKAKATYAVIASKPDGWVYFEAELLSHMQSGRDSLRSALNELEVKGWIERRKVRRGGKFAGSEMTVFEQPFGVETTANHQPTQDGDNGEPTKDGRSGDGTSTRAWFANVGQAPTINKERNNTNPPLNPPQGGEDGSDEPGGGLDYVGLGADNTEPSSPPNPTFDTRRRAEEVRQSIYARIGDKARSWANPRAVDAWLDAGVPEATIVRVVTTTEVKGDIHSWRFFERRVMAAEPEGSEGDGRELRETLASKADDSVRCLVEAALNLGDVAVAIDLARTRLVDGLLAFSGNAAMHRHFAMDKIDRFRKVARAVGLELKPEVFA